MTTHEVFFIIIATVFFISWILTLIFSLLIIVIIVQYWQTQTRSIANFFACNSCLTLIFHVLAFCIQSPLYIQRIYSDTDYTNPYLCKISACLATFSTIALSYSYLVQAISCFSLTILYKRKILQTFRFNSLLVITSWLIAGTIAILLLLSPTAYQYEDQARFCALTTKDFFTSIILSSVVYMLTINTMIILYGYILHYTIQKSKINPNSQSTQRGKRNLKVLKKILVFVSILLLGGLPYFISTILNRFDRAPWQLYSIVYLSMSFTGALEAMALFITNQQVKTILWTKWMGRSSSEVNHLRATRANRIVPYQAKPESIQTLPVVS